MEVRRGDTCNAHGRGFAEKWCRRKQYGAAKSPAQSPFSGHPSPPPGTGGCRPRPYLLRGDHGDHVGSLLPHHLPEVVARVRQGPLRGDVVPFGPANHHLQTKESIGEAAPNPGRRYLLTTGRPHGSVPTSKPPRPQGATETFSHENAINPFFLLQPPGVRYKPVRFLKAHIYINISTHTYTHVR